MDEKKLLQVLASVKPALEQAHARQVRQGKRSHILRIFLQMA